MKWSSAISIGDNLEATFNQCADAAVTDLDKPASLVVVFVSAAYSDEFHKVPELLQAYFPEAVALGCSAQGVIGNALEEEENPAVAITAGHLPNVNISAFRVTMENLPSPDDPPEAWTNLVGVSPEDQPKFLVLMEPFGAPGDGLLAGLDFAYPRAVKVGGVASGGHAPGSHALYLGKDMYTEGIVGVALSGDIQVDAIVAQGCRPIGEPKRITKCHQNLLLELDGQPPIAYLQELYPKLSSQDQSLLEGNLLLGIAMDPLIELNDVRSGDFLIRNLVGGDQEQGVLAVGAILLEGQLVQFHVRDAVTSGEDLQGQITRYLDNVGDSPPIGALMFQCNGRGIHMYGRPNHDAEMFRQMVGSIPLGGFFCGGEIGPVGEATYLHGFTSSLAIFRKPQ